MKVANLVDQVKFRHPEFHQDNRQNLKRKEIKNLTDFALQREYKVFEIMAMTIASLCLKVLSRKLDIHH